MMYGPNVFLANFVERVKESPFASRWIVEYFVTEAKRHGKMAIFFRDNAQNRAF